MHTSPALLIARKRDGHELSRDDIERFITGFSTGTIPDYQMAAMAMAIYCRGMTDLETAFLTECMLHSGITIDWTPSQQPRVDKHSTGGIGDKVSLILAPLLACCGCQVPMLSGRGLGITGGTLDKLESIEGFRTNLELAEIQRLSETVGCVITGASSELAPADKKLYALRDVTSTIASIPLITASIMSKKLAENLDALVLDVKCGNGTFMTTPEQGRALAKSLVMTGQRMGLKTSAFLTNMSQPLGHMIGNSVEVQEAIDTLQGRGPADLRQLVLTLAAELLFTSQTSTTHEEAYDRLTKQLDSGSAYEKFEMMIRAQGGNLDSLHPPAPAHEIYASNDGYVTHLDCHLIGTAVIELGGGRRVMNAPIDPGVGLELLVCPGDLVTAGQRIGRLYARDNTRETGMAIVQEAITIGAEPVSPADLIITHIPAPTED